MYALAKFLVFTLSLANPIIIMATFHIIIANVVFLSNCTCMHACSRTSLIRTSLVRNLANADKTAKEKEEGLSVEYTIAHAQCNFLC